MHSSTKPTDLRPAAHPTLERAVAELAAKFVTVGANHLDQTLIASLRRIAETLDLDRGVLWQFTDGHDELLHTHSWIRPEIHSYPSPTSVSVRESFPWMFSKLRANELIWNERLSDMPECADRHNLVRFGTRSNAAIPLIAEGTVMGAVSFGAVRGERPWTPEIRERLEAMARVFAHALARRHDEQRLEQALANVEALRRRLERDNVRLRQEVHAHTNVRSIAAESRAIRDVLALIHSVASTNATVFLMGEAGTGKEVFAHAIHDRSARRHRAMIRINCRAIAAATIENELFGREGAAPVGAPARQVGRIELANGTTLFLDEVGALTLAAQSKLLRLIQDRLIERQGGTRSIEVDVRVIAGTKRDLKRGVADGSFREDLYHQLNSFPITIPPLRERVEDIPVLVWTFVEEFARASGKTVETVSPESLAALQRYSWPDNVRELRNLVERAVSLAHGPRLVVDLPAEVAPPDGVAPAPSATLAEVQASHIRSVLDQVRWRVRGKGGAAEVLGMKPTTLDSRMARLGIRRPAS